LLDEYLSGLMVSRSCTIRLSHVHLTDTSSAKTLPAGAKHLKTSSLDWNEMVEPIGIEPTTS
jgi:hypothetical protein